MSADKPKVTVGVRLDFSYEMEGEVPPKYSDKFLAFIEAGLRATVLKPDDSNKVCDLLPGTKCRLAFKYDPDPRRRPKAKKASKR